MKSGRHYTLIMLLALAGLIACATTDPAPAPDRVAQSERIILAEMARVRGDVGQALGYYVQAVPLSDSEAYARDATLYAMEARAWPDALLLARRWQVLAPDSLQAQWHAGRSELLVGDLDASERAFRRWLAASDGEDWIELGRQLQSEPRQWQAWRLMRRLLDRDSGAAAWEAGARMALALNRLGDAQRYADQALARDGDRRSAEWLQLRARAGQGDGEALARARLLATGGDVSDELEFVTLLWELNRSEEALNFVQSRVQETGRHPALIYTRALLYTYSGEHDAAMTDFRDLMGQGFRVRETWFQMAQVARRSGDYETALNWFDRVLSGDEEVQARVGGVAMLLELGREAEAWERVRFLGDHLRALSADFYLELAPMLAAASHADRATALCNDILGSRAENAESYYRCGLALLQADRDHEQGLSWLRKAHDHWPDEPTVLNALGYSLADQGRELRHARRLIRRALDRSPDSGAILDSMGWVEYRLGNNRKALEWLERAWQRYPSPEVAAHRVEVHWVKGDRELARQLYREADERWPDEDILRKTWQRLTVD